MFDFKDNQVVESLDTVPKDFHGLYVEADGKFKLDTEDPRLGSAVKALTGMNNALNASRGEARDLKSRVVDLTPLADFGKTPEEIQKAFQAKLAEIKEASKGSANEDVDKAVKSAQEAMNKAHKAEVEKRDARNGALQGQLYGLLVNAEAVSALSRANAIDPDLIMPHIQRQVKVHESDGKLEVRVLDKQGEVRFGGTGQHMTIGELVEEMKAEEKYHVLFRSDAPTGGGARPHSGHRPAGKNKDMSSTDKIAAGMSKK